MAKSKRLSKDVKRNKDISPADGSIDNNNDSDNSNHKAKAHASIHSSNKSIPAVGGLKIFPTSSRVIRLFPMDWKTACTFAGNMIAVLTVATLLGYMAGAGWLGDNYPTTLEWRFQLAQVIRSSTTYQLATFQPGIWEHVALQAGRSFATLLLFYERRSQARDVERNPSHPHAFAILREAIVREKGGYVHDDLGFLEPAPCGAARGLGMVRDTYHQCQTRCFPGTSHEKKANVTLPIPSLEDTDQQPLYRQEEVLIKVPLSFQMTRQAALDTLSTLIPAAVQQNANLHMLDDSALLVLLLAHERGVGRNSRWLPYISTLPHQPSCGYNRAVRPQILDMIEMLRVEYDVETTGWATELVKAAQYATRIAESLDRDYGPYLRVPPRVSPIENLEWALCIVASRATAGHKRHGSLRLVPLMDMINHDSTAGQFVELMGNESWANGDFVQAEESDAGAFVVRSLRNGRRRPLKVRQELLVDYNVPHYAPLDWLVSTGFVPPERWGRWRRVDRVFPPQRWNSVPAGASPTAEQWSRDGPTIMKRIKETDPEDSM